MSDYNHQYPLLREEKHLVPRANELLEAIRAYIRGLDIKVAPFWANDERFTHLRAEELDPLSQQILCDLVRPDFPITECLAEYIRTRAEALNAYPRIRDAAAQGGYLEVEGDS